MSTSREDLGHFLWKLLDEESVVTPTTSPDVTNIRDVFSAVEEWHRPTVVRLWNAHIEDVCASFMNEAKDITNKRPSTIGGEQTLSVLAFAIAFIVGGWFASDWLGLLVGLTAAMTLLLHTRVSMAAHHHANVSLELAQREVGQTKSFILGYQLSDDGKFLRDEEPWRHIQTNKFIVDSYIP